MSYQNAVAMNLAVKKALAARPKMMASQRAGQIATSPSSIEPWSPAIQNLIKTGKTCQQWVAQTQVQKLYVIQRVFGTGGVNAIQMSASFDAACAAPSTAASVPVSMQTAAPYAQPARTFVKPAGFEEFSQTYPYSPAVRKYYGSRARPAGQVSFSISASAPNMSASGPMPLQPQPPPSTTSLGVPGFNQTVATQPFTATVTNPQITFGQPSVSASYGSQPAQYDANGNMISMSTTGSGSNGSSSALTMNGHYDVPPPNDYTAMVVGGIVVAVAIGGLALAYLSQPKGSE